MQRLLRRACHATDLARERNVPRYPPASMALFERCYDTVLTEGFAFHEAQPAISTAGKRRGRAPRRVGHNLLLRISTRKGGRPALPVRSGGALHQQPGGARWTRMMKLRQKISGGFQSYDGAEDFAVIRSLISTARKQGWDILQALTSRPAHLITELKATLTSPLPELNNES